MNISIVLFSIFTAVAWSNILTEPGQLFAFVPRFVQKWTSIGWIHKLTFECPVCIGGQLALWTSVFMSQNVIEGLTNISITIVTVYIFQQIMNRYE